MERWKEWYEGTERVWECLGVEIEMEVDQEVDIDAEKLTEVCDGNSIREGRGVGTWLEGRRLMKWAVMGACWRGVVASAGLCVGMILWHGTELGIVSGVTPELLVSGEMI